MPTTRQAFEGIKNALTVSKVLIQWSLLTYIAFGIESEHDMLIRCVKHDRRIADPSRGFSVYC